MHRGLLAPIVPICYKVARTRGSTNSPATSGIRENVVRIECEVTDGSESRPTHSSGKLIPAKHPNS